MSVVRVGMAAAGDRCWVTVQGQLDRDTSEKLRQHVTALGDRGCVRVLLDLRETTFIAATALSALVAAMDHMAEHGGELLLRAPPADVYAQGRLTRLGELLALVDEALDEAEAIARLSRLFASEDLDGSEPDYKTWGFGEADPRQVAEDGPPAQGRSGQGGTGDIGA